jgi:hypothetical protein
MATVPEAPEVEVRLEVAAAPEREVAPDLAGVSEAEVQAGAGGHGTGQRSRWNARGVPRLIRPATGLKSTSSRAKCLDESAVSREGSSTMRGP